MSRVSVWAVDFGVAAREVGWGEEAAVAAVSGRSPLGWVRNRQASAPRVKRPGLRAGVIGASGGRLTRAARQAMRGSTQCCLQCTREQSTR